MKIVLVHPDVTRLDEMSGYAYARTIARKSRRRRIAPVGLLMLRANSPYKTVFLDNRIDRLSDSALATRCIAAVGKGPGIVAFGGTCMEWPQAAAAAKLIKTARPYIATVYGGPNATARPEKHVRHFDCVIGGFGVDSFNRLTDTLADGGSSKGIPGVSVGDHRASPCYPDGIGVFRWPTAEDAPTWYRSRYDYATTISSIGCPFSCRFCSSKSIWHRKVFYRDVDQVMREIAGNSIGFRDDNFTQNKDRLFEFCRQLESRKIKWSCQSRVSSLDEETLAVMKRSGCRKISCGFESANDETLAAIGKGHTVAQIEQLKRWCKWIGIRLVGGWVIGFPNEGEAEIKRTVAAGRGNLVCLLGWPVSELYHQIQREGLVEHDWQDGETLFPRTRTLSRKRVEELARGAA